MWQPIPSNSYVLSFLGWVCLFEGAVLHVVCDMCVFVFFSCPCIMMFQSTLAPNTQQVTKEESVTKGWRNNKKQIWQHTQKKHNLDLLNKMFGKKVQQTFTPTWWWFFMLIFVKICHGRIRKKITSNKSNQVIQSDLFIPWLEVT